MTSARWLQAGLAAAWALFAVFALWGVPGVPFHPDESTYLYMSRDFDSLFRQGDPAAVTWRAANQPQDVIRYRLLDGALAHYLPGLGRLLGGYSLALPHDWDWSASWAGNATLGALPDAGLLNAARWPAATLTALRGGSGASRANAAPAAPARRASAVRLARMEALLTNRASAPITHGAIGEREAQLRDRRT